MPDFNSMTHEELARYADMLRQQMATASLVRAPVLQSQLDELEAAARQRPQQITGYMGTQPARSD